MTRIGRDLLGVVDSLDSKDRWLAYGLFVKAGLTSYYGLAVDSLVEAAREEEYWSSLPESARQGWGRWLRKANAEPIETKGIMGSMSRAVEAAEVVHDRRLRYALIRYSIDGPWAGVRQSAIVRFWDEGDDAMKDMLMEKLSFWADIQGKNRHLNERGEWVNRQELLNFWTAWLHN
ncbi:MAG: hypothetical protein AB7F50_07580 [Fimbriimonadaceae bacterium]